MNKTDFNLSKKRRHLIANARDDMRKLEWNFDKFINLMLDQDKEFIKRLKEELLRPLNSECNGKNVMWRSSHVVEELDKLAGDELR